MESSITTTTIDGFNKSLAELSHFGDCLKSREKKLEQQYAVKLDEQKNEFDIQLQVEKKRIEQLETINRALAEQIEQAMEKQIDREEDYTTLDTKYSCCLEESNQIKEKYNETNLQIQQLEKNIFILKDDQVKLTTEVLQLKTENEILLDKIKEIASQSIPNEALESASKAVNENEELRKTLIERDKEILRINEQINNISNDESQRVSQLVVKVKNDFRMMYEIQSKFFCQQLDVLKRAQRDNIAKLYRR